MRTIVINLISGPGAGKTTTASLLFAHLKLEGRIVEYVGEYAKKLVWMNNFEALNDQYLVSMKQYKLFQAIQGKVEFIVTDASLLHGIYYNTYYEANVSNPAKTEAKIWEYYRSFENINIFVERGSYTYEQAGRYQTESEARQIDTAIEKILLDNGVTYGKFRSGADDIPRILEYIKLMMDPKPGQDSK